MKFSAKYTPATAPNHDLYNFIKENKRRAVNGSIKILVKCANKCERGKDNNVFLMCVSVFSVPQCSSGFTWLSTHLQHDTSTMAPENSDLMLGILIW